METSNIDEPAMVDAAMMDPTMEDLFGDAADGLNVGMPPAPLPTSLIVRIAEMQSRGCCAKLAWSNTGSIARISADGSKVLFYTLVRDMKTKLWTVSAASKFPVAAPEGRTFVHVQFSGIGVDLAIVDNAGMVHMRVMAGALGRMLPADRDPSREIQPKNELDAIVGMHWLCLWPAEFTGPYIHPANKVNNRWEAHLQQRDQHSIKAHHPAAGRHAMLYITRSTELTLQYQNEGQGWMSTSIFLESTRSSDELISHAALGEEGADLLAATYDCCSRLRLYRVTIEWNATQHSRGPNMNYTLVTPTLEVHHLTASHNARAQHADGAKLTHLRLIPVIPEAAQSQPTLPTVIGVFTQTSFSVDATQSQGSFSVIAQWRVESSTPTLHTSFKKLTGMDPKQAVRNQVTVLRRVPDIITNKVILSVKSQMFDTIMAFGASDGTVEMRDRVTMDIISPFGDTSTASNLPSSGFDHLAGPHNNHITLSADGSAVAVVRADGKIDAHPMTFTHGWQVMEDDIGNNQPFIEAAAVCVARQYAFLCYNSMSNDESLALLPIEASAELRSTVVKTIFKMVNKSPDISMHDNGRQQMTVVKEPVVPRVLSVQLALGTDHATGRRNLAAQYAFAVLNLRHISTALVHTVSSKDLSRISTEAVYSLRPLVRWSIDLIIYIVATLLDVKRTLSSDPSKSAKQAFEDLVSKTGSPAIHLLLCSFSRALLRFQVSWIGKFIQVSHQIAPRAQTVAERQDLAAMFEQTAKLPVKLQLLETMLGEFDIAVRNAYNPATLPADRRSEIEMSMVCDGAFPPELEPALESLMGNMLTRMTENADQSRLYFWNTEHMQLANSKPRAVGEPRWDVIRKVPLRKGMQLRFCRRCGSEMEDLPQEKSRELPSWLLHAQKYCICVNYWVGSLE